MVRAAAANLILLARRPHSWVTGLRFGMLNVCQRILLGSWLAFRYSQRAPAASSWVVGLRIGMLTCASRILLGRWLALRYAQRAPAPNRFSM